MTAECKDRGFCNKTRQSFRKLWEGAGDFKSTPTPRDNAGSGRKKSSEYNLSCLIKDYNDPVFAPCDTDKPSREVMMKLNWKILNW